MAIAFTIFALLLFFMQLKYSMKVQKNDRFVDGVDQIADEVRNKMTEEWFSVAQWLSETSKLEDKKEREKALEHVGKCATHFIKEYNRRLGKEIGENLD